MRKIPLVIMLIGALIMSGCSSIGEVNGIRMGATHQDDDSFCARQPMLCVLAGAAIAGGVIALIYRRGGNNRPAGNNNAPDMDGGNGGNGAGDGAMASDRRLKRNIKFLHTTSTGIKLYAFRYLNDDRYFVGAMAQDLLVDPRYAHAVSTGPKGFYRVAYGKIGMEVIGGDKMHEAGQAALSQ